MCSIRSLHFTSHRLSFFIHPIFVSSPFTIHSQNQIHVEMYEFCVMRYNSQCETHTQKAQIAAAQTMTETTAMAKAAAAAFLRVCSEIHYCSFVAVFPIRSFMLRYCCFFPVCSFVCLLLHVSIQFNSFRYVLFRILFFFFFFISPQTLLLMFQNGFYFGVKTKRRPNKIYVAQNHVTNTKTQCNPILCFFQLFFLQNQKNRNDEQRLLV